MIYVSVFFFCFNEILFAGIFETRDDYVSRRYDFNHGMSFLCVYAIRPIRTNNGPMFYFVIKKNRLIGEKEGVLKQEMGQFENYNHYVYHVF